MRKSLIPMLVSLALCGAATTAIVMSSARAQPGPHKPMMVAASGLQLAANDPAPPPDTGDRTARLQQMCNDLYARQTAQLAYLEASLQLTASERPLFQRWKDAKLGIAHRHADACARSPIADRQDAQRGARADSQAGRQQDNTPDRIARERPDPATMMTREEDSLKQRLADIETERPALEAFYNALSPAQRKELARAGMQDRMGRGGMMRHRMFAEGQRPMDRGSMDLPGPQGAPPPER
jgi:hypothetical protein